MLSDGMDSEPRATRGASFGIETSNDKRLDVELIDKTKFEC